MINLINGDCIEEMDKLEDASINCFILDLPFKTTKNKWESVINLGRNFIGIEKDKDIFEIAKKRLNSYTL